MLTCELCAKQCRGHRAIGELDGILVYGRMTAPVSCDEFGRVENSMAEKQNSETRQETKFDK